MPADPERTHRWRPEPVEQFRFPAESEVDLLKDYFRARLGRGLSGDELEWLGNLVSDFLAWSQNHCCRREARVAALKMVRLLSAIDEAMSVSKDPERTWCEISLGLGLPSACLNHLTGAELASSRKLSKMAVSKSVHRFLRVIDMGPAFNRNRRNLVFH